MSPKEKVSIRRQCALLGLNRSSFYYKPVDEDPEDLYLMRKMDEEYYEHPTKGVIGMVDFIKGLGMIVGPKRVRRLLRKMGLMAIYPKKNLSKLGLAKYIHPYKLRRLEPCNLPFSGQIGQLMEELCQHLETLRRNKKTIRHYRLNLYRLESFLESNQVQDVKEITDVHITKFLATQTNGNVRIASYMRVFFRYLFENQIIAHDLSESLQHYKWKRKEKLPSVFTSSEVMQIESSIKREDSAGRRNYAILLLATRLGLRASDIANITFNNFNWECNKIKLVQLKTGKEIELPLLANIGEAIIDYLKYGRKKSTLPNVFLYTRAPYVALSGDAISACITHLIELSGVNTVERKHGAHSMRHSLASRFLENREPLPVISEALGHCKTSSTMFYLSIDKESLRQCALDVPSVPVRFYEQKGGFYEC